MSEYLWVDEPWMSEPRMSEPKTFNSNSANWEYNAPKHPYIISTLPETYRKETWERLKQEEERSRRLASDEEFTFSKEMLKDLADAMRKPAVSLDPMAILTPDEAETHCRQHAQGDHRVRITLCPLCYEESL